MLLLGIFVTVLAQKDSLDILLTKLGDCFVNVCYHQQSFESLRSHSRRKIFKSTMFYASVKNNFSPWSWTGES